MQPLSNQYDFIMKPGQPPKKSALGGWLPGNGSSKKQRILIVAAGGGLLLLIGAIVFSLLSGASNSKADDLVLAAQQQTELIRISDIGLAKARGSDAKNLAITTKLSLTTEQQPLLKLIKRQGLTLNTQDLAAQKNTKTDQALIVAEQNNQFDEVFVTTLQTGIANYQQSLKKAFDTSSDKAAQQSISAIYAQAQVLFPLNED